MINTIFYFTSDATFNYETALRNGDISEYTIVFNSADHSIRCKGDMFGRMNREDIVGTLLSTGDISDILPAATDNKLGGIKTGYTSDVVDGSRTYAVELDENNRAYVNVPWTDTITPAFDDTELRNSIDTQRTRIDNYISDLTNAIQDATEALLNDMSWVENNLSEGETGRLINENIDEYFRQQYGVWDWVDPNDHTQGKVIRTSVIELNVDSIKAYTGMTTPSGYSGTNLTTALSQIYTDVGRDFQTGAVTANSGLMSEVSELDKNTNNIIKMAASALQLKTSLNGSTISSASDLASVITNGSFTGYSGLSALVSQQGTTLSAKSSLLSRVINDNGTTNSTFKNDVIAGLATEAYADGAAASAKTSLVASINNKTAGITVFAEKSGGKLESGVTINADHVLINSNTTVAGKLTTMDADIQGKATINQLNTATARVESKADLANNRYIELANGNGTFTGYVNAKSLIAGDPEGINIKTTSDRIEFCQGGDVRAYFVADGNGMQLHVWDATGKEHIIDFTNGVFKQVNTSTYTKIDGYLVRNGNHTSTPFVSTTLYKDQDGKFYTMSGSTYSLANVEVYTMRSANSYYATGNSAAYIFAKATYNGSNYAVLVQVDEYTKTTITNGVIASVSSNHMYHCPAYPTSISVTNNNVSVATSPKFVNPTGGSAVFSYMWDGQLHDLASTTPTYSYVSESNGSSSYSVPPIVYDQAGSQISL